MTCPSNKRREKFKRGTFVTLGVIYSQLKNSLPWKKNTSLDEPVSDDQGVLDGARSECFTIKNTKGEETFRLQPY
jgi:hypothetical protein